MTQERTQFNREKFAELVMWTAKATLDDRMMSMVKLERLLYYIPEFGKAIRVEIEAEAAGLRGGAKAFYVGGSRRSSHRPG